MLPAVLLIFARAVPVVETVEKNITAFDEALVPDQSLELHLVQVENAIKDTQEEMSQIKKIFDDVSKDFEEKSKAAYSEYTLVMSKVHEAMSFDFQQYDGLRDELKIDIEDTKLETREKMMEIYEQCVAIDKRAWANYKAVEKTKARVEDINFEVKFNTYRLEQLDAIVNTLNHNIRRINELEELVYDLNNLNTYEKKTDARLKSLEDKSSQWAETRHIICDDDDPALDHGDMGEGRDDDDEDGENYFDDTDFDTVIFENTLS